MGYVAPLETLIFCCGGSLIAASTIGAVWAPCMSQRIVNLGKAAMPTLFLASVVVALFLAVATPAAQQGTSEIRGRVVDQSGAVQPSVTIVLTNEGTGAFRETISGADGSYVAAQLIPGRYRIEAKRSGFRLLKVPHWWCSLAPR